MSVFVCSFLIVGAQQWWHYEGGTWSQPPLLGWWSADIGQQKIVDFYFGAKPKCSDVRRATQIAYD